jgi:hypothetical protein
MRFTDLSLTAQTAYAELNASAPVIASGSAVIQCVGGGCGVMNLKDDKRSRVDIGYTKPE